MTISNQTILRNDYIANGTNTIFAFNFPIFYEPSEAIKFSIQVIITNEIGVETIKTENTDYTITYNALNIDNNVINQGNVVFTTAPANLYRVSLLRKLNLTQNTNLTNKGTDKFSGANVEASLDKLTLINLENKEIFNRCVLLPKSTNLSSIELPIKLENANKVITVNSAGNNLEVRTLLDQNLLPVSSFMETILLKETANEARQGLGVDPATNTIQGISYLPQKITIANNQATPNNDIVFSGGNFVFSDFSGQAYVPAMNKKLNANWAAGSDQGGLDTGTKANSTWYYCYAIYNPTTQASDFLFSASATSPTLPSGFTKYKYVGSFLTNSSGNIIAFKQVGNYFYFNNIFDASPSSPTSGVYSTYTLSVPRINGIIAMVNSRFDYTGTGIVAIGINYRVTGSSTVAFESFYKPTNGYDGLSAIEYVPTNNSAQIDVAFNYTAPATNFKIITKGFIDNNL